MLAAKHYGFSHRSLFTPYTDTTYWSIVSSLIAIPSSRPPLVAGEGKQKTVNKRSVTYLTIHLPLMRRWWRWGLVFIPIVLQENGQY